MTVSWMFVELSFIPEEISSYISIARQDSKTSQGNETARDNEDRTKKRGSPWQPHFHLREEKKKKSGSE